MLSDFHYGPEVLLGAKEETKGGDNILPALWEVPTWGRASLSQL